MRTSMDLCLYTWIEN